MTVLTVIKPPSPAKILKTYLLFIILSLPALTISQASPNVTAITAQDPVHCTTSQSWVGDGFDRNDCIRAIDQLYNVDMLPRQSKQYEFLAEGARGVFWRLRKVQTPKKYIVGE